MPPRRAKRTSTRKKKASAKGRPVRRSRKKAAPKRAHSRIAGKAAKKTTRKRAAPRRKTAARKSGGQGPARPSAGYLPLGGDMRPPPAPLFSCPKGDFNWVRRVKGEMMPRCPRHHLKLLPTKAIIDMPIPDRVAAFINNTVT